MTTPAKRQKLQLPKKSWKEADGARACQDDADDVDDNNNDAETTTTGMKKRTEVGSDQCLENWFAPLRAASKQRASFASARWDAEAQLAIVTVRKGAALNTIGKTHQSQLALHVEEAVWLVDKGALQLRGPDDCCLSTQQCYALLDSTAFPLSRFLAYAHLKRAGYIPLRHDPDRWRSDPAQPPLPLPLPLPASPSSSSSANIEPSDLQAAADDTSDNFFPPLQAVTTTPATPKTNYTPYFPLISPSEAALPSRNWWPSEQDCLLDGHEPVRSIAREPSTYPIGPPSTGVLSREFLSQTPTSECLRALQAMGPKCTPPLITASASSSSSDREYTLHYDVYRARKGFRMSAPGPPDFCLAVYSFDEKMPSMTNIHRLLDQAQGVPVRVCIDSSGTLSFLRVSAMPAGQLDALSPK